MKIVRNQIKKIKTWLVKEGYKLIPVCVLFLVAAFYMMFLTAKEVSILEQDGKAIIGDVILDTFLSGNETDSVKLASFSAYDSLYENHGKLYLSNNQEISATYPLYVNENLSIVNISASSKLVTTKYQEEDGYPYFTLSNGVLYNYGDGEQASYETYLFLKLSNGLFVSSIPITIETANETMEIPINSILYIEEAAIQYYSPADDTFTYHRIEALDDTSKIKYQEEEITFQELLDNLKITTVDEENKPTPLPSATPTPTPTETPDEEVSKAEKPVVQLSDVKEGVYGLNATLSVTGDVSKITKAITFTVTRNGNVVLRKQYISFGQIRINGLEPGEQYEIKGTYSYQMDNEDEVTETFYQDTITMNDISSLGPIVVSFETGSIYSNKIALNNLKITEESDQEALYGLSKAVVEIDGEQYNVGTKLFTSLSNGDAVTYESPELLDSNKIVNFVIIMRDNYGNDLPMSNNTGSTRTAKEAPTVTITTLKNEVNDLQLQINLKNSDNVVIENYRYVIYTSTGEIFMQDQVPTDGILKLTNLNSEDWYQIFVYGSYDIEDGNGKVEDHTFANMKLTAVPLTTLGLAHINVTSKATQNSATLSLTLDSATDKRLLPFIKNITVKLTHDKEEYEHVLTAEELQAFISNETINISYENLKSQTEYKIDIQTTIGSLEQEEVFDAIFSLKSVKTLRRDAKIYFRNRFTMQTLIDFDVKIDDPDNAIESGRILLEVRNQDDKLINVIYLDPNQDFKQITLDDLTPQQTYRLTYIIESYNTGYDNSTYQENYILYEEEIKTDGGITGEIQLHSLLEKPAGKNLLNFKSNFGAYSVENVKSLTDESVTFNGKNAWINLLDAVPVKPNTTYVLSYKLVADNPSTIGQWEFGILDFEKHINGASFAEASLTKKNIQLSDDNMYAIKFTTNATTTSIRMTGYINKSSSGGANGYYTYSDFMLTEGDTYVSYEPFEKEEGYEATIHTTINDSRAEITNQDYYIDLYKEDELLDTFHGFLDENHQINQAESTLQTEDRANYTVKLKIKVRDRFYELDSINFTADQEIRSIYTVNEYLNMVSNKKYLVQNDLDFTSTNKTYGYFYGILDFQGHKVTTDNNDSNCRIMNKLQNGTIENVVVDAYMNKTSGQENSSCFVFENSSGTIRNIQMNLKQSNIEENKAFGLIVQYNSGVIENFTVHLESPLYALSDIGAVARDNRSIIRNGYVYGEAIDGSMFQLAGENRNIGGIAAGNIFGGLIENVFILSKVNGYSSEASINSNRIANIARSDNSPIKNSYSVGAGENRDINHDVNTYDNLIRENVYYVADDIYANSKYTTKISKLTLQSKAFQNETINSTNMFEVDSLLELGYYPQVKMDDCMPTQEYIPLPEVENDDLADIISTKVVESSDKEAIIDVNVYNPNQETISSIDIQNIETEIINQTTNNQETIVRIKMFNPTKYVSNYELRKLSLINKFNISYERNYNIGEKTIQVAFYRNINSINDWSLLNTYPTENFKIKNDLDFSGVPETKVRTTKNFQGILDGENHTISNIRTTNYIFIQISGATMQNINFNNIQINATSNGSTGIINYNSTTRSSLSNININDISINTTNSLTDHIGGLIGFGQYIDIKNCTVNNIKIKANSNLESIMIGGLVGYLNNGSISNSFVNNSDIETNHIENSNTYIGGIVGLSYSGKINYTYVTGKIDTNIGEVGGLVGNISDLGSIFSYNYSLVNINGSGNRVGGISGSHNNSGAYINNNVSLGSIYTSVETNSIGRIVGYSANSISISSNYAWNQQLINGMPSTKTDGEVLKTQEELLNYDFWKWDAGFADTGYFDFSELEKGYLPKLLSTTGELLPNQPNLTLDNPDILVTSITLDKRITDATILIEMSHDVDKEVKSVHIDGLNILNVNKLISSGNTTTIELDVSPNLALDNYTLDKITYLANGEEKTIEVNVRVSLQFYKDINSIEDWQKISSEVAENYRLNADLDFSNVQEINHDVMINRMEGIGDGHTIKNITITDQASWHLIKSVYTTLSNITFENITLTDSSNSIAQSNRKYAIIELANFANISNVKFKNITIQTYSSCIGSVSQANSTQFTDITLDHINISGVGYLAGLISNGSSSKINDSNASNITIIGTGNYVGGFVGYNPTWLTNISISNSNITGIQYVGGIAGFGAGNSMKVTDSTITGVDYVGGSVGFIGSGRQGQIEVKNSHIYGSGKYIGGLMGGRGEYYRSYVVDSTVEGTSVNSKNVGGLVGTSRYAFDSSGIINTSVTSLGDNVGGLIGLYSNEGASTTATGDNMFVIDSEVIGANNIGGVAGYIDEGSATNTYIARTTIQATSSNVGGFYGYSKNDAVLSSANYTRIQHSMIQNSTVIGNDNVGGLIGYVTSELNSPDFDDIYLDVNVQATNIYGNVNIGIGNHNPYISAINNLHVYENSTVNNKAVKELSNSDLSSDQLWTAADFHNPASYTLSSQWRLSDISNGYYPKLYGYNTTTLLDYQEDVPLPMDTNGLSMFRLMSMYLFEEFPTYEVYTSGIDTINIEFLDTTSNAYFRIETADSVGDWMPITKRIYTLNYNFNTDFKVSLTDGRQTFTKEFKSADLTFPASVYGDNYYYIENNVLKGNQNTNITDVIHVYKNYALKKNGEVYNLSLNQYDHNVENNMMILDQAKPLYEFLQDNGYIRTYANFTTVTNNNIEKVLDYQVISSNNTTSIVNESLSNRKNMNVMDSYGNNEYHTILGTDGMLHDLKENIKVPNDFKNSKIKFMTDNIGHNNGFVIIQYEDGKLYGFNYRTGQKLFVTSTNTNQSVTEYLTDYFTSSKSVTNDTYQEYQESIKLKDQIYESEKQDSEENTLSKDNYVTSYNPITNDYEIYKQNTVLDVDVEEDISETQKIYQDMNLYHTYISSSKASNKWFRANERTLIIAICIAMILVAIAIGYRNIYKKNRKAGE